MNFKNFLETRVAVAVVAIASTFALLAQPAHATAPTPASGTFVIAGVVTSVRQAGPNTIISQDLTEVISGTYNGTVTGQARIVVHADGSANIHGEFVCLCTVAGQGTGTLTFRFSGTGTGPTTEGQYRIVGASGGLAGAHGLGAFSITGSAGTYTGSQHYDP